MRTNGQTSMTKLIVYFHNSAKAPKEQHTCQALCSFLLKSCSFRYYLNKSSEGSKTFPLCLHYPNLLNFVRTMSRSSDRTSNEGDKTCTQNLYGKSERKKWVGRSRCRLKNNVKVSLKIRHARAYGNWIRGRKSCHKNCKMFITKWLATSQGLP